MKLKDIVSRQQLRWSDVNWGALDGNWPAISFSRGTSAWSQLTKISIDAGEVVISVCAGQRAPLETKRRITGFSFPDRFQAPTKDLVEPGLLAESNLLYGDDRWPDSIGVQKAYRFVFPPVIDQVVREPRLLTGTRGRYLADLHEVAPELYDQIADLEIEAVTLYRSPEYQRLAAQPPQARHRKAGRTVSVPKDIQQILLQKADSIYQDEKSCGGPYKYNKPERKVGMLRPNFDDLLFELWESQRGRCGYCEVPMEPTGLAQVSIDRIVNDNREYGQHNVHLTCWLCNRGKNNATHEEMLDLAQKRKIAWEQDQKSKRQGADEATPCPAALDQS